MHKDVTNVNGVVKLKREKWQEDHLTLTKETCKENGTYLTHKMLPLVGATGERLAAKTVTVLKKTTIALIL